MCMAQEDSEMVVALYASFGVIYYMILHLLHGAPSQQSCLTLSMAWELPHNTWYL